MLDKFCKSEAVIFTDVFKIKGYSKKLGQVDLFTSQNFTFDFQLSERVHWERKRYDDTLTYGNGLKSLKAQASHASIKAVAVSHIVVTSESTIV